MGWNSAAGSTVSRRLLDFWSALVVVVLVVVEKKSTMMTLD